MNDFLMRRFSQRIDKRKVISMKRVIGLLVILSLLITLASCSGGQQSDNSAYIQNGLFTADTETLLQAIENHLETISKDCNNYERNSEGWKLDSYWPSEGDLEIHSILSFYSGENNTNDNLYKVRDIKDTSEIPRGLGIIYYLERVDGSYQESMETATKATMEVMRTVGFTEERISDEELHDQIIGMIDNCLAALWDEEYHISPVEMLGCARFKAVSVSLDKDRNKASVALYINPIRDITDLNTNLETFGSYEQDNDDANGKEPIEWIVLDEDDEKMLLISDKAIEYQRYNDEKTEITWENCSLRKWLNEDFITEAFDSEEQKRIVETTLEADNNPQYKTDGGNDTTDKVFILNFTELEKYLPHEEMCQCKPTQYVIKKGCYVNKNGEDKGYTTWFLRTPADSQKNIMQVKTNGGLSIALGVDHEGPIRPAIWVKKEQ